MATPDPTAAATASAAPTQTVAQQAAPPPTPRPAGSALNAPARAMPTVVNAPPATPSGIAAAKRRVQGAPGGHP